MCFISILLELNILAVFARDTTTHAVSLDKGGRGIFGRDSQLSPKLIRNKWIFTERQGNVRFEVFLLNTGRIKYYFNKNLTYEFFLRFVRTTGSGPRGKTKIIVRTEIWPICEKRKKKYTFAATSSYSTILKKISGEVCTILVWDIWKKVDLSFSLFL